MVALAVADYALFQWLGLRRLATARAAGDTARTGATLGSRAIDRSMAHPR